MNDNSARQSNAWTELEYSPKSKNNYLTDTFFIPGETEVFLCRADGSRTRVPLTFVVFKRKDAPAADEWEDDPVAGPIQVMALGDSDEEVEPAETIFLDMDPSDLVSLYAEDDNTVSFRIDWPYGKVEVEKSAPSDEKDVFTVSRDVLCDTGVRCTLSCRRGGLRHFDLTLRLPFVGFSLTDADGNVLSGDVDLAGSQQQEYTYAFVGDARNDRFSISLDDNKLNYLCVLREDGSLAVRDMRERLALVMEIPSEGSLQQLLQGAHSAVIKNKDRRWRVTVSGETVEHHEAIDCNPVALVRLAYEQFDAAGEDGLDALLQRLVNLEQRISFQWFWLKEEDWSHEHLTGLIDIPADDATPEMMMAAALKYNRFETFLHKLMALSFVTKKTLQGDQLQARNNKRKIARCAKHILAHRNGKENIWTLPCEDREEILSLFGTFHREFTAALDTLSDEK